MSIKSQKAKSNTSDKSASITVRLDPKLKYGLEILARKQYRNLSSLVEWALNKALSDYNEGLPDLVSIWDVYEADRLVKLALYKPELLNFDEQKLWKLIKENGLCWHGSYKNKYWTWQLSESYANWGVIRSNWKDFQKVAAGEAGEETLPKWQIYKNELNDEIPF
jgi:hypothetical protein